MGWATWPARPGSVRDRETKSGSGMVLVMLSNRIGDFTLGIFVGDFLHEFSDDEKPEHFNISHEKLKLLSQSMSPSPSGHFGAFLGGISMTFDHPRPSGSSSSGASSGSSFETGLYSMDSLWHWLYIKFTGGWWVSLKKSQKLIRISLVFGCTFHMQLKLGHVGKGMGPLLRKQTSAQSSTGPLDHPFHPCFSHCYLHGDES